jgi:hypothetical protein
MIYCRPRRAVRLVKRVPGTSPQQATADALTGPPVELQADESFLERRRQSQPAAAK